MVGVGALVATVMTVLAAPAFAAGGGRAGGGSGSPGIWTLRTISNLPTTSGQSQLSDVYAASPGDAWAVGFKPASGGVQRAALVEHWNGSSWQAVPIPVTQNFNSQLDAVSGSASDDVWAAGELDTSTVGPYHPEVTLVLHWNGSSWTAVSSPNPKAFVNHLTNLKSFGPADVWASGFSEDFDGAPFTSFTIRWNGSSWTTVTPSDPTALVVGGTSSSDIWMMGTSPVHFNGSAFTTMSGPTSHRIVAISAADAWGTTFLANGTSALTRWDGAAWRVFQLLPASDSVSAITALSATDVWAVGQQADLNGSTAPLTLHFTGTSFLPVTSPSPQPSSAFGPGLLGVAAAGPSTVIAAGTGAGPFANVAFAMDTSQG